VCAVFSRFQQAVLLCAPDLLAPTVAQRDAARETAVVSVTAAIASQLALIQALTQVRVRTAITGAVNALF
jgi:hypothetical protein